MRASSSWTDDSGSASLEFVTAGLVLLVPLVYLVLAVSAIQSAALATEGAARQAARVFVIADSEADARASASAAVEFAFADHGLDPALARVTVACDPQPCLTRRSLVTVSIDVDVPLPLAPAALGRSFALAVPIRASATQQVSRFWVAG